MALTIPRAVPPPLFLISPDDEKKDLVEPRPVHPKRNMWDRFSLHRFGSWLKKDGLHGVLPQEWEANPSHQEPEHSPRPGFLGRRTSRKVVRGLSRPITFRRTHSERRGRLAPREPDPEEMRAQSMDRRGTITGNRTPSPLPLAMPSVSAPDVSKLDHDAHSNAQSEGEKQTAQPGERQGFGFSENSEGLLPPGQPPPLSTTGGLTEWDASSEGLGDHLIKQELESKWILNLSMHFRDKSDREKFFITYAEEPNRWRRVTVSCDYRNVPADSLEADLKSLHYQRDKSERIYEAIRDSLKDIQFYDTVTNLKLQTSDGRLHVHVTEDVNEIIPYPPISAVNHIDCPRFPESAVRFDSHISGFVYKVNVNGCTYIKKEIPGPDTVEEFLYEVNALSTVRPAQNVISLEGIIVDDQNRLIKGLIISYAEQGALVDLLYDWKGAECMTWERREKWAKQIVQGLSEIHESGFVQGDFTLSNIVVDNHDDAKIIDINRRGCPVGWEPPEISKLIEDGQRISIYIGVKSDIFQLGMVLWAIAEEEDEPERQERPLMFTSASAGVPQYFRDIVTACLSLNPRDRPPAKDLLGKFPAIDEDAARTLENPRHSVSTHRSDKEYIDPATAVDLADIDQFRKTGKRGNQSDLATSDFTFAEPTPSTDYRFESSSSFLVGQRGRSLSPRTRTRNGSPYVRPVSSDSINDSESENEVNSLPSGPEPRWEQIYVDGDATFIQRGSPVKRHCDFAIQEQETAYSPTHSANVCTDEKQSGILLPANASIDVEQPALSSAEYPQQSHLTRNASSSNRIQLLAFEDEQFTAAEKEVIGEAQPQLVRPPTFRFSPPPHQDSGFHEVMAELDDYQPPKSDLTATSEHKNEIAYPLTSSTNGKAPVGENQASPELQADYTIITSALDSEVSKRFPLESRTCPPLPASFRAPIPPEPPVLYANPNMTGACNTPISSHQQIPLTAESSDKSSASPNSLESLVPTYASNDLHPLKEEPS